MAPPERACARRKNCNWAGGYDNRAAYSNADRSYSYSNTDRHAGRRARRRPRNDAGNEGSPGQHEGERAKAEGTDRR
jgi:hypothetical protein